jgi:hypothetical protein
MKFPALISLLLLVESASGFAFVAKKNSVVVPSARASATQHQHPHYSRHTTLRMIDDQVLLGAGVAVAGLVAGIGLVAFTEAQGDRAKSRGGGLSERMATNIAGGLLEDVEVSSVEDLGSLTSQLEKALKESGGATAEELDMTEESKKRLSEEADDGW